MFLVFFFFLTVLDGRDGTGYLSSGEWGLQRKGVTGLVVDLQPPSLNPRGTTQVTHSHIFGKMTLLGSLACIVTPQKVLSDILETVFLEV